MNKKILAAIAAGLICVFAVGCGTTYQKALNEPTNKNYGNGYFTSILDWSSSDGSDGYYRIVYANDTKVKYFIISGNKHFGITPLYNADGTLQVYDGE